MASAPRLLAATTLLLLLLLLLFSLNLTPTVFSVEEDEMESMLNVLRARGYNLFSNAISTSDIIYQVISGGSFTFFAPTDSSLFTLDMTNTASDYISTLRCHAIPIRLLFPELRLVPSGSSLPTLVNNHPATVRLETPSSLTSDDDFITINGVRIVFPDLFYSLSLAVHGLRGNLNCTPVQDSTRDSHSRARNRGHTHPPPPLNFSSEIGSNTSGTVQNPKAPSSSPANLLDDHGFNSPVISEGQAKPTPWNLSNHIESPSPTEAGHRDFSSSESEPTVDGGFSPSHSPAPANLPPQVSPAYDLWLDAPTSAVSSPSTEPGPPPEFSENDDPMSFPPTATEIQGAHMVATASELNLMKENELPLIEEDELKSESWDRVPITATDEMAGIMGNSWEKCEPFDEANYECTMIDGIDHASIPDALPAFAYTRQPIFANTGMPCCNG